MVSDPFVQKVAAAIKRHRMAGPGERLLVGVSGGADSVCLTRVLHLLGYRLGLAHVNHDLRGPESDGDQHFVEKLAARLTVPYFETRVGSGELSGNLEASARAFRRQFLLKTLRHGGFRKIALAHSRDDRIETFLLHLLRGSGTAGLTSMEPAPDPIIRPLIGVTRAEIEGYLTAIGQDWRTDESNRDRRFTRNRIRHDVLPRLSEEFNPRLSETLGRTIDILSAENTWMDAEVQAWLGTHFMTGKGGTNAQNIGAGSPRLVLGDLGSLPIAFTRRILRAALEAAGSGLRDVGFDHIEQVRTLLEPGKSGKVVELPGDIHVERTFDALIFPKAGDTAFPGKKEWTGYEYELAIPGRVRVSEAGLEFEARVVTGPAGPPRDRAREAPGVATGTFTRVLVDGESIGPCVKIRNWKNGDTYDPAGRGPSKLKTLFQEKRIPRSTRLTWPVCIARSSIVWVASFPVSREFAPTERSRRIIELEAIPSTC